MTVLNDRKFLDADFDGFVMLVGKTAYAEGRQQVRITLANGNNETKITLWAEEVDALISGLKKAQKAMK